MFDAVGFLCAFGVVEPVQRAHKIAGDAADALKAHVALILAAVAVGAFVADQARIPAQGIPVHRVIDCAIADAAFLHLTDDFFKGSQVPGGIAVHCNVCDVAGVRQRVIRSFKPDFVIIEFSVNDESNTHFMETYEGLVRKIYGNECKPAVLLVHNVCYDNGSSAQLVHGKIGRYYELPAVSMQSCIYQELLSGKLENRTITPDDLHPNDFGHELVASVITEFLGSILKNIDSEEVEPEFRVQPLTLNAYENSIRYRNDNSKPSIKGFQEDSAPQNVITDIFKKGWTAKEKGASITFEIEGSCIGVQYRKTIQLPAPVAELILDGDESHSFRLDANFDETWGDKLVLDTILEHGEEKKHTVEIRLTETHEDDKLPFYLVSVIGS